MNDELRKRANALAYPIPFAPGCAPPIDMRNISNVVRELLAEIEAGGVLRSFECERHGANVIAVSHCERCLDILKADDDRERKAELLLASVYRAALDAAAPNVVRAIEALTEWRGGDNPSPPMSIVLHEQRERDALTETFNDWLREHIGTASGVG